VEGRCREEKEKQGESDSGDDEPERDVAAQRAERGAQPYDAEHREAGAHDLEKKLPKRTPEALETAVARRRGSGYRRHDSILAQKTAKKLPALEAD